MGNILTERNKRRMQRMRERDPERYAAKKKVKNARYKKNRAAKQQAALERVIGFQRKACNRKRAYATLEAAQEEADRLKLRIAAGKMRRKKVSPAYELQPIRCIVCGQYHIANVKNKAKAS